MFSRTRNHVDLTDELFYVLFRDEMKVNLDDPDGWAYYCYDIRNEQRTFLEDKKEGLRMTIEA